MPSKSLQLQVYVCCRLSGRAVSQEACECSGSWTYKSVEKMNARLSPMSFSAVKAMHFAWEFKEQA